MTTMYTRITLDVVSEGSLIKRTGINMNDISRILQTLLDAYATGKCSIEIHSATMRATPFEDSLTAMQIEGSPFEERSIGEILHPDDYDDDEIEEEL
jgi:hypothetical protein